MSIPEQLTQRKRNVHRRRNAYHAPADMSAMQQRIAAATLHHVRQGKSTDWRNLAISYPLAFDLIWQALGEVERAELGITMPAQQLRNRMVAREMERFAAIGQHK